MHYATNAPIWLAMANEPKASASDVIPLLETLSVSDLDEVIAAAEQRREAKRDSGRKELMEEFKARAAALGLSLGELVSGSPAAARGAEERSPPRGRPPTRSPAVKFRNPETGETWSGRGRTPRWLTRAEHEGRSREEFAAQN